MKYRCTQPFIAFGKIAEVGDPVELTEEQAVALMEGDNVVPYEIKIQPPLENKVKKKPSGSAPRVRASRSKTVKRSKGSVKK